MNFEKPLHREVIEFVPSILKAYKQMKLCESSLIEKLDDNMYA